MLVHTKDEIHFRFIPSVTKMKAIHFKLSKPVLIAVTVIILLIILTSRLRQPSCNKSYLQDYTLQHLHDYCNSLSVPVSGQEGTVPPSDGYKLESVYVAIRHGDRSGLHGVPNYKDTPLSCVIGENVKDAEPLLRGYLTTMKEQASNHQSNAKTEAFHKYNLYPDKDVCASGDLTPIGVAQHIRNGALLHRRYVEAHSLFDGSKENVEMKVHIRSTDYVRTFQSAVAFLYGFLPKFDMSKLTFAQAMYNPMCLKNNSSEPCSCAALDRHIDTMASTYGQFSPRVMAEKKTRQTYEHIGAVFGVLPSTLPRPSHIYDLSMVHFCHHEFLPGNTKDVCVDPWAVMNIYDIIQDNGRQMVTSAHYQKMARLKMHPMLRDVKEHMEKVAAGNSPVKMMLFSGHDSTIEPLATALNFSDGHWSRYASRISIELYSKKVKEQKEFYIRTLYDGKLMTQNMQFCQGQLVENDLGLCPLEHFKRYIDRDMLKDVGNGDYVKMCREG